MKPIQGYHVISPARAQYGASRLQEAGEIGPVTPEQEQRELQALFTKQAFRPMARPSSLPAIERCVMSDSMKAIDGYFLITPGDLHWRPSNLMRIPNASRACGMERTGDENLDEAVLTVYAKG